MNVLLQRGALEAALLLGEHPSVFHCHDGHASFLPAIAREDATLAPLLRDSRMVVTIHNAGRGLPPGDLGSEGRGPAHGARRGGDREGRAARKSRSLPARRPRTRRSTRCPSSMQPSCSRSATRSSPVGWAARTANAVCRSRASPTAWTGKRGIPRHPERTGLPSAFDPGSGDLEGKRRVGKRSSPASALARLPSIPDQPLFAFVSRLDRAEGRRRAPGRDPHPRAGRGLPAVRRARHRRSGHRGHDARAGAGPRRTGSRSSRPGTRRSPT